MIAFARSLDVFRIQFFARNLLAHFNGFEHGAIAQAAAAHVVNLSAARSAIELVESLNQIGTMNVVAHLFALIAEHLVWMPSDDAFHQVGEESMQLRSGVIGSSEAPSTEAGSLHSKIFSVFLDEHICCEFGNSEEAV